MAAPDDAEHVLCALRLGWFLAEVRGRNRPGGQPGVSVSMPENDDHALPLRIERSATELRIEAQKVVAQLAVHLEVDASGDGTSFGVAIDAKARLLDPIRAPKASTALRGALDQLRMAAAGRSYRDASGPPTPQQALQMLQAAVGPQQQLVTARRQAAAAAEVAAEEQAAAQEQAAAAGEQRGLDALSHAIVTLPAINSDDPEAARARVDLIQASQHVIVDAASEPWEDLAELLWRFDAHIQDRLSANSETQACAYQLGRGLAETYWALDPYLAAGGSSSWDFLLGQ